MHSTFDVWAFDLNSLYDETPRADVVVGSALSAEEAIKLHRETQDYKTASWVTLHGKKEPYNISMFTRIWNRVERVTVLTAAKERFPNTESFTLNSAWSCLGPTNPHPTYCVFDAEDMAQDDCLYCHLPYERK